MDPYLQQWFTARAVADTALDLDDVWTGYTNLGGWCDRVEFQAYLSGLALIDELQRDMVSHAVNEALDGVSSPARRAAYSTDDVSLATGVITESSFESCTDAALRRFVTSSYAYLEGADAERRRLDSLTQTGLLGTPAEERFDRITREEVPDAVKASVEFREVCPASAVVMRKILIGDLGTSAASLDAGGPVHRDTR